MSGFRSSRQKALSRLCALMAAAAAVAGCSGTGGARTTRDKPDPVPVGSRMPEEGERHQRTYMAYPSEQIWEQDTPGVRSEVAAVARAIAEYEPVTLLADPQDAAEARKAVGPEVTVMEQPVEDLWIRDSGPTFIRTGQGLAGIDFHFNGWGNKREHPRDAKVAARILSEEGVRRVSAPLTAEGGSLEVDGAGTLLVTESSLVNDNRNPGKSRDQIESELKELLGVRKVIWVKGVKGKDITDYHIDSLARFVRPGVVVMSRPAPGTVDDDFTRAYQQARDVLGKATDAEGRTLQIIGITEADPGKAGQHGADFLGSYVNYYLVNGAVIMPRFGDKGADQRAAAQVRELYPGREVRQLDISTIATGGGGIHCATQQRPQDGP